MLRTLFKNQVIEHQKNLIFTLTRIIFTFIIELWAKISLSKPKRHNYATVQMVYWFSSGSLSWAPRFEFHLPNFPFIFLNFFSLQTDTQNICLHDFEPYWLFLSYLKLKLEKTILKCHWYRSVQQTTNFVCTLNHTVVSKTTLVRTATCIQCFLQKKSV